MGSNSCQETILDYILVSKEIAQLEFEEIHTPLSHRGLEF